MNRAVSRRYRQDEIVRCAWLYYVQDRTQDEVARELGVSRATVARLLKEAKVCGLVQIQINAPLDLLALADRLRAAYRLARVHLVPTVADAREQKVALARELSAVFTPKRGDIIAVSWGTTLSHAIDLLPAPRTALGLTVVSVLGGIQGDIGTANPYNIAFRLGQKLGATVYMLQAPAFVHDPAFAALLMREISIQRTLEMGGRARIALFGAGDLTEHSTLERIGAISREERQWLVSLGAVGDLLGHFLNIRGEVVKPEGRFIPMSLPLADLMRIPERICLAGGPAKHEMLLAMLRAGYITTLVTDEETAKYLLAAAERAARPDGTASIEGGITPALIP